MRAASVVLAVVLLLAPAVAFSPGAEACRTTSLEAGVPCGRIYPAILMQIPDQAPVYDWDVSETLEFEATLVFRFDMGTEGYTAGNPNDPIAITFEFPRKPDWVELTVTPERILVDVNDPTYVEPDLSEPATPQLHYVFHTPITITAKITDQAVLRDGFDHAKLLVFAKSTESGLYQSGYGIKEIRVLPSEFVYESALEGERDVFTAVAIESFALEAMHRTVGGTTVTVTPPAQANVWEPLPFHVKVDPAPTGRMTFSVTDEEGALVAMHGPVDAMAESTFPVTLAKPGLHTAVVTLLPEAGTKTPPLSYHLEFTAGDLSPQGFSYPRNYQILQSQVVPVPQANVQDPLVQHVRDIPFFVFDTAQSTVVRLSLATPGLADIANGGGTFQFSILDPTGKQLQLASVDPINTPSYTLRIGTLPMDGWYTVRVSGLGAPAGAAYDVRIEASYAFAKESRNRADGIADATGGILFATDRNLTLPIDDLGVWKATPFAPTLEGSPDMRYALSVYDAQGRVAYATGLRAGDATFSPPAPGTYRASLYVEAAPGAAFAPLVRTFTFGVAEGKSTVVNAFPLGEALQVPASSSETLLAAYQLPVPDTTSFAYTMSTSQTPLTTMRIDVHDVDGKHVGELTSAGDLKLTAAGAPYTLLVHATSAVPGEIAFDAAFTYGGPVTLEDAAGMSVQPAGKTSIPGLALGVAVAVMGAVAVGGAFLRRK